MAKINATYGSGVYLSPDFDYRKLEEARHAEKRARKGRGGDDGGEATVLDEVKRQTFAIPFDLICTLCRRRLVRGSHVYVNRRATKDKYLGSIRIWELEFHCKFCDGLIYLVTDPETPKLTGGYKCAKNCERTRGDLYEMNQKNEEIRAQWAKDKDETETNPLEAMERENEAARRLAELNRGIEEDVDAREAQEDSTLDLLRSVRARRATQPVAAGPRSVGVRGGSSFLSHLPFYTPGAYASDVTREDESAFEAFASGLSHSGHEEQANAPAASSESDEEKTSGHPTDGDAEEAVSQSREASSTCSQRSPSLSSSSSSSSEDEVDVVARTMSRYGGQGNVEALMSAPASSSAESILQRGHTHRAVVPTDSVVARTTNVFLDNDDAEDDDDDNEVENGTTVKHAHTEQRAALPSCAPKQKATTAPTAVSRAPRSLLSRLADSDDD